MINNIFVVTENKLKNVKNWRKSKEINVVRWNGKEEKSSLSRCLITIIGSFTSQGTSFDIEMISVRILMIFILFFGLIMSNSYSARLITQVGTPTPSPPKWMTLPHPNNDLYFYSLRLVKDFYLFSH